MKIYDITRTLQDAPVYPGDESPVIEARECGGAFHSSTIKAGSHSGTHADAFSHLLQDGLTIDAMPLENYCGRCRVLSVPEDQELIRQDDLKGRIGGAERILLHSGGTSFLCEEAAEYLAGCGILALVTDSVSVGPADNEESIHRILMENSVAIIENAVLDGVPDGDYLMFAFPIKYGGCDGAPVRAVLVTEGEASPEKSEKM